MYTRLCGIIKTNTLENPGCFCFSRKCGGFACVGAVLGKRGSGIVTRLTGDARELPPAGAVQPVSTGFLKSVPLCGTPQLFTVACGHNPAYAGRCGGTSASLKCGREPAVPPTNAPLLKCGARVRWMAWLVRPHFSTGGFAPYVAEGFAAVALKPSCSPPPEERRQMPSGLPPALEDGVSESVPPSGTPKLFTFHFSLFTSQVLRFML